MWCCIFHFNTGFNLMLHLNSCKCFTTRPVLKKSFLKIKCTFFLCFYFTWNFTWYHFVLQSSDNSILTGVIGLLVEREKTLSNSKVQLLFSPNLNIEFPDWTFWIMVRYYCKGLSLEKYQLCYCNMTFVAAGEYTWFHVQVAIRRLQATYKSFTYQKLANPPFPVRDYDWISSWSHWIKFSLESLIPFCTCLCFTMLQSWK